MKLTNVNTTNIRDAIELGCRTMSNVFNADDDNIPFFASTVLPTAALSFNPMFSEAHVPGRHLNALLNAENALGITLDERVIDNHSRAAFRSYSGPVALPLNRDRIGGRLINFVPHNLREGFHALYALVAFRASEQAHKLAEASIATILELWHPERGWDRGHLEGKLGLTIIDFDAPFIAGPARAIGPLVKYYRVTNSAPALHLAIILAEHVLGEYIPASGKCDLGRLGTHTHSITCVMSSLAQLAATIRDASMMARVKSFYDNGLPAISNALGWSVENTSSTANPDRGEANNTGDILETALLLGRWGYTDYYQDAERILRGHLLPSQLRDISFIPDSTNDGMDATRDVAQRHLGAFGFPAPYGHAPIGGTDISFNMDIVGGATGSLCAAYREVTRKTSRAHFVNLLFDHETEAIKVQSPYTNDSLQITVKQPAPLMVRIPLWARRDGVQVHGSDDTPTFVNGYLYISEPPQEPLTITFPLPRQELLLDYNGREIRAQLRGDAVEYMQNFGADLTYFDPFPA